jgi:hypothetical protein
VKEGETHTGRDGKKYKVSLSKSGTKYWRLSRK